MAKAKKPTTTAKKVVKKVALPPIPAGAEEFCGVIEKPAPKPVETPDGNYTAEWNARIGGEVRHIKVNVRKVGEEYFDAIGRVDIPEFATITKV